MSWGCLRASSLLGAGVRHSLRHHRTSHAQFGLSSVEWRTQRELDRRRLIGLLAEGETGVRWVPRARLAGLCLPVGSAASAPARRLSAPDGGAPGPLWR